MPGGHSFLHFKHSRSEVNVHDLVSYSIFLIHFLHDAHEFDDNDDDDDDDNKNKGEEKKYFINDNANDKYNCYT